MIMSSNAKIGVNPDVLEGKGSQTPPDFDGVSNLAEVPQIDHPRVDACHDRITQQPIEVCSSLPKSPWCGYRTGTKVRRPLRRQGSLLSKM